jgi:sugar lactone lactonase YvrE
MAQDPVTVALDVQALNGESPRWSARDGRLFWVDTRAATLHIFDPATKNDAAWTMPSAIGCCVLTDEGALVALRTGLYEFGTRDGSLHQIGSAPYDIRHFVFNDGSCDPLGRFLVGEMYEPLPPGDQREPAHDKAPLFRFSPNGTWIDMTIAARTFNGLAWSPDGRTLYQTDTAEKTIYAYDYDLATAQLANRRVFATVATSDDGHGPDGAAVDRDGFYTTAVFGEGCLLRFDPEGRLERRIDLPAQYPTMPAYGGADLATLYVTTSSFALDPAERARRPVDGALLSLTAPAPGLKTTLFSRSR